GPPFQGGNTNAAATPSADGRRLDQEVIDDHTTPIRRGVRCRPGLTPFPPLPFAALRARASGEGERPPPHRLLDARLPGMDLEADPRLRTDARLRGDRAARAPEEHGPDPRTRALTRRRAHRRVEAGAARARAQDIRPRRLGAAARAGPCQARRPARRGTPLHRPGGDAARSLRAR